MIYISHWGKLLILRFWNADFLLDKGRTGRLLA